MYDQTVSVEPFHCHVTEFFVRTMHGVSRLKGDDPIPAVRRYVVTYLSCGAKSIGKVRFEVAVVKHLNRACQRYVSLRIERFDARMFWVGSTENLTGQRTEFVSCKRVNGLYRLDCQHWRAVYVRVQQGNAIAHLEVFGVFDQVEYGRRPEQPAGCLHGLPN